MTTRSKHLMATDVSATGRESFRQGTLVFLVTGTMVVCLKHVDIKFSVRDRLKMSVNTLVRSARGWSSRSGNPYEC
jgi:hypothetical protein